MTVFNRVTSLMASIRASLHKLAGRIRRANFKAEEKPVFHSPPDPTIGLFGEDDRSDEGGRASNLDTLLQSASVQIDQRMEDIKGSAVTLNSMLRARREGAASQFAQGIRILISFMWLGVAVWLFFIAVAGPERMLPVLAANIPPLDAYALSKIFFTMGAVGAIGAFIMNVVLTLLGKADNKNVRSAAANLGDDIVAIASDFDQRLSTLRNNMNNHNSKADAIDDLSRAYVLALESHVFFGQVPFILEQDDRAAKYELVKFLRNDTQAPPPLGAIFLLGYFLGALSIVVALGVQPVMELPSIAELGSYPWAGVILLLGSLVYGTTGAVTELAKYSLSRDAMSEAYQDALYAIRGSFTTGKAPRPTDLVRRIVDALDVLRAWIGGSGGSNQRLAGGDVSGSFSTDDSGSSVWRRPDSAVKFVDAGFQSSPEGWRTDAYEKKLSPKPEAKRGRDKAKKAPRD